MLSTNCTTKTGTTSEPAEAIYKHSGPGIPFVDSIIYREDTFPGALGSYSYRQRVQQDGRERQQQETGQSTEAGRPPGPSGLQAARTGVGLTVARPAGLLAVISRISCQDRIIGARPPIPFGSSAGCAGALTVTGKMRSHRRPTPPQPESQRRFRPSLVFFSIAPDSGQTYLSQMPASH